jgi:MFS family permease
MVWLLAAVNAVAMSGTPMMMLVGCIIGSRLAASEQWATLPIALMVIGTALGVVPASRGMARLGRKRTFALFLTIGIGACAVSALALALQNFLLFCAGALLLGATNAALQQVRFAAMECVPLEKGPTAASIIMCAGIVAAFLGPELALLGKDITPVEYGGSFLLAIGCFLVGGALLAFYTPAKQFGHAQQGPARPWRAMLVNPTLLLAVASGAVAYVVMSFVMTATPISMHLHHGHSLEDTKWVIQSHIAAMFLPSLLTAWLFRVFTIHGLMLLGLLCYGATITIGLVDVSVLGFWGQLVMLGIGWNFLFISGTALLPTSYREGEQYRAQALNDSVVFSTQALASLSAGWAITAISWQAMLLLCMAPIALMLVALLLNRRVQ